MRFVINKGIAKADEYGFDNRGPTRFYLELMFAFGGDFDTDPQLAWARHILTNPAIATQMSRADFLYQAMNEYSERVLGPNNEFAIAALRKLQITWFDLEKYSTGNVDTRMLQAMEFCYPEKSEYLGSDILHALVQRGQLLANRLGISSDSGKMLLVGLMFGFGHGVWNDALYPWVRATLTNPVRSDPNERAQRLLEKAKLYLNHVLQHLDK